MQVCRAASTSLWEREEAANLWVSMQGALCTVKFVYGREEVFCLEHLEVKMSSISIYLMEKVSVPSENSP